MRKAKKIVWILDGLLLMVLLSFGITYLIENSNILLNDKNQRTANEENNTQIQAQGGPDHNEAPTEKPNKEAKKKTTIVFGGDVVLKESHLNSYDKSGASAVVSNEVQEIVKNADVCMLSEEFPLSSSGEKANKKENTYRVDPKYVSFFKDLGVDIVTLANDHVMDYGSEALLDTCSALDGAAIKYSGAGEDPEEAKEGQCIEVNGYKIAFVAANKVIDKNNEAASEEDAGIYEIKDTINICEQIESAKKDADYVVVYVHWGEENHAHPDNEQRELAKAMIDAGANAIVGSHTHCLQGIEYYKECPIIYSLGDFVYGQAEKRTALLTITLDEASKSKVNCYPCYVKGGKTDLITKKSSVKSFQNYMESISYGAAITGDGEVIPKSE